jgi:hypothetical protein
MSPNVSKEWLGELNWKTLFPDSKSEGVYPVLTTMDGQDFRLRLKDAPPEAELSLRHLDGLQVKLVGYADDLRGHWRINIPWLEDGQTVQQVIVSQSPLGSLLDETSINSNSTKDS